MCFLGVNRLLVKTCLLSKTHLLSEVNVLVDFIIATGSTTLLSCTVCGGESSSTTMVVCEFRGGRSGVLALLFNQFHEFFSINDSKDFLGEENQKCLSLSLFIENLIFLVKIPKKRKYLL